MTNSKKYHNEVSRFAKEGAALFAAHATPEELAQVAFDDSPEGRAAERERNRIAIAARDAKNEADRLARQAAKKQRRADKKAACI